MVFWGSAEVSFELGGILLGRLGVHHWGRGDHMGQVGGEVTGEEFDQSAILFFLIGVVEHFAVVSGVVGSVLSSPGLVGAVEEGDFLGNEFPCGGCCEVAVIGWAMA